MKTKPNGKRRPGGEYRKKTAAIPSAPFPAKLAEANRDQIRLEAAIEAVCNVYTGSYFDQKLREQTVILALENALNEFRTGYDLNR